MVQDMDRRDSQGGHLKKTFSFWSALGMAVCCSGAWEGWTASLAQGLVGGGPVGLLYGWLFVSAGIACVASSMAELISMYPSAGGQYVWVSQLAPPKYRSLMSWFNAWVTIVGLLLGSISCAMGAAVQIQSYAAITTDYEPARLHAFLIVVAIFTLWLVINIFALKSMSIVNESIIYVHILGFLACIITLWACTPKSTRNSADYVFTKFSNGTGWDDGVAWCVAQLAALFAYFSLDSATHYAEEMPKPEVTVPRVIFWQTIMNGVVTIPFVVTVLFNMGDPDTILASKIGFTSPFSAIILQSTRSPVAAIFLNGISTWTALVGGLDLLGASARIVYSLGRDGGLPPRWGTLNSRFPVPIESLCVLYVCGLLISMIYIWNSTAFYGIMGSTLVAFQLSYNMPIALKVFYRKHFNTLPRGPWRLGSYGIVIDVIAFVFGIFMIIFMSFPSYIPVTATNMNYACVIIGVTIALATTLWLVYAKNFFRGYIMTEEEAIRTNTKTYIMSEEEAVTRTNTKTADEPEEVEFASSSRSGAGKSGFTTAVEHS